MLIKVSSTICFRRLLSPDAVNWSIVARISPNPSIIGTGHAVAVAGRGSIRRVPNAGESSGADGMVMWDRYVGEGVRKKKLVVR